MAYTYQLLRVFLARTRMTHLAGTLIFSLGDRPAVPVHDYLALAFRRRRGQ